MSQTSQARFGIMTAPSQVDYDDILRVWREADTTPQIEHAWLFDHLMPIFGDLNGPTYEGWSLLSALAAQTHRLRVGLLVPVDTPAGLVRAARHHPRCDRPRDRRRLRARRPRAAVPLPGRRRPVGRRRTHHQSGIVTLWRRARSLGC